MDNVSYMAIPGIVEPKELKDILNECCKRFGVSLSDVKGRSRLKHAVFARQSYCYLAWKEKRFSLTVIGMEINRDHSTVLYSVNKVKDYLETKEKEFIRLFGEVK